MILKDALGLPIPDGPVKVWLDDDLHDRQAPEGWVHLRTVREVCFILLTGRVVELSLDNDLNGDEEFGMGFQVADFLLDELGGNSNNLYPETVTVHSANPSARDRMVSSLMSAERYGVQVTKKITPGGKPSLTFR